MSDNFLEEIPSARAVFHSEKQRRRESLASASKGFAERRLSIARTDTTRELAVSDTIATEVLNESAPVRRAPITVVDQRGSDAEPTESTLPVLLVDSRRYRVSNLSEFNFRVVDDKRLKGGENYQGRLMRDADSGVDIEFRAQIKNDGLVRGRFTNLSAEQKRALRAFVGAESGQLDRGDSLNRLTYDQIARGDAETTQHNENGDLRPASRPERGALPTAKQDTPEKGASQRVKMLAAALLVASMAAIFIVVGAFITARNSVDISHAALVGNFLPVQSDAEGTVSQVFVREGQSVKAGDALFQVQDKESETNVAFAKADLLEAQAREAALRSQVKNYHKKLEIVADNLQQQIIGARADLKKAQIESSAQADLLFNMERLALTGGVSEQEVAAARSTLEAMQSDEDSRRAAVGTLQVSYRATTENGIIAIGDVLDDELSQLEADLAIAEATRVRAKAHVDVLSSNDLMVTTPTDGRIYALYRQNGEFVKQADPILSVSLNDNYWATGSVRADDADRIRPGQLVNVTLPSMNIKVTGEVAAIGHRGLYTSGGWSQDFRTAALDVPIKVRLPNLPEDVPSGLRLNMSVDLGFKWPWQRENEPVPSTPAAPDEAADPIGEALVVNASLNVEEDVSVPGSVTSAEEPVVFDELAARVGSVRSWQQDLADAMRADLRGIDDARIIVRDDGSLNFKLGDELGFTSGSAYLDEQGRSTLEAIGKIFANHKDVHIQVSGHTDDLQPAAASIYNTNQELSAARAQAVMEILNRQSDIPPYRTTAIGMGDSRPVARNDSDAGRQSNRRIEFDLKRRFLDQASLKP